MAAGDKHGVGKETVKPFTTLEEGKNETVVHFHKEPAGNCCHVV